MMDNQTSKENFNLLDRDWIPVLYLDGRWTRVGIRKALEEAGRIRQIAASNPMDRVATLRFLLALLYWCKGNPQEGKETRARESFPEEWFKKLEENRGCFNLLGGGKRFYQDGSPGGMNAEHTTHYLIHEVPSGTNKWHFRHSTDKETGLCPACCAMGLLRLPVFATQGGSGKSPGINAKPPNYVLREGVTLAACLRLNWQKTDRELGTPEWENPGQPLPQNGDVPLLMGLTWLPRKVWLGDPAEPQAGCIQCGRREFLVRNCVWDGKGSLKKIGFRWNDPHVIYFTSGKGKDTSLHASDVIVTSDAAAGQWASVTAGVLRQPNSGIVSCVGFSTDQDKYLEAIEFKVASTQLVDRTTTDVEQIKQWQNEGSGLHRNLVRKLQRQNEREKKRKHTEIKPLIDSIRPQVEHNVSAKARDLLAGGDEAWQQAAKEYCPMMDIVAKSVSPGVTVKAVERRRLIASVSPDMRPKAEPGKKSSRKKGDAK